MIAFIRNTQIKKKNLMAFLLIAVVTGVLVWSVDTNQGLLKTSQNPSFSNAASGPTPVGVSGSWNMLFDDEFNGTSLDTTKWRTDSNWGMGIGCQDNTNNVKVSNGILNLYGRNGQSANCSKSNYTESVIETAGFNDPKPFVFTYGYTEARVNIPPGQGLWPAVWLYSASGGCDELDLAEWLDNNTSTIYMTPHYSDCSAATVPYTGTNWASGWHTIGLDWEPGKLTWYIDGASVRTVTDSRVPNLAMYALLDLTVGGSWPGNPNSTTLFPADYQVDYLRVWQKCTTNCTSTTATPTPVVTPKPTPTPTPTPIVTTSGWSVRDMGMTAVTHDTVCNQASQATMTRLVSYIPQFNANFASDDIALDSAATYNCTFGSGNAPLQPYQYMLNWANTMHSAGLHVIFRGNWNNFAGDYGQKKLSYSTTPAIPYETSGGLNAVLNGTDKTSYIGMTYQWILAHPGIFQNGDIWEPFGEAQNNGIANGPAGTSAANCPQNICQFPSTAAFNQWISDFSQADQAAFKAIGKNVTSGWFGLAGDSYTYVTKSAMAYSSAYNMDHFAQSYSNFTNLILDSHNAFPNMPMTLEWGDVNSADNTAQLVANTTNQYLGWLVTQPYVTGFEYWYESGQGNGAESAAVDYNTGQMTPAGQIVAKYFTMEIPKSTPTPTPTAVPTSKPTTTPVPTVTPTPVPTTSSPSSSQSITSFELVNAQTGADIKAIPNGANINVSSLPQTCLNIRANTSPTSVGSVVFNYDGNASYHSENYIPYYIGGKTNNNPSCWTLATGNHTLIATPHSSSNGGGTIGNSLNISFTVTLQSNLLSNGNFVAPTGSTNWLSPWVMHSNSGYVEWWQSAASVNGYPSFTEYTSQLPINYWDIQLQQVGIPLQSGKTYTITFYAKGDVSNRPLVVQEQLDLSPWTSYIDQQVNLTTTFQKYTLTFTSPVTIPDSFFAFNFGRSTGEIWINEVSMTSN